MRAPLPALRTVSALVISALAILALAAAAPAPKPVMPAADGPEPLVIAAMAGPLKEPARKLLVQPYAAATGTELGDAAWDGSVDGLTRLRDGHGADLALLDGHALAAGCRAQTLARIDWGALGRDRFWPEAATDCGAGATIAATVLAWDRDKLPAGAGQASPDWAAFWDVARHPGRRGLHRGARGNLEIALMADGVSTGDVYRTLRSADGIDRAFRKLDQLKPYIVWWDQASQPVPMLLAGKVLLTSVSASALPASSRPHVGIQWTGSLSEVCAWARLADSVHGKAAAAGLLIASDAARIASFARATGLGPATREAFALLPAGSRADLPALPSNRPGGLAIDEGFWLDNGDKLEARFAGWIGK